MAYSFFYNFDYPRLVLILTQHGSSITLRCIVLYYPFKKQYISYRERRLEGVMASSSIDIGVASSTEEELAQVGGRTSGDVTLNSDHEEQMEEGKGDPSGSGSQGRRPHATVKGKCFLLV